MEEEWRAVVGWEGLYEVSSEGRVRSLDRLVTRKDGVIARYTGRVLRAGVNSSGRLTVRLSYEQHYQSFSVHRLMAEAFIPNPEGLPLVRHLNDKPLDLRLENLAWGTHSDNQYDRVRNGIYRNGRETQTHCKHGHELTPDNLYRIRGRETHRICKTCTKDRAREYRSRK